MSNDPFAYFRAGAALSQSPPPAAQPLTAPPALTPSIDLHVLHERLRRRDAARVANAPDNDLFGVLSGPRSSDTDWRDLIDGVFQASITPATGNGTATVALSPFLNNQPIWSGAARDFVDPSDAIRCALVVRTLFVLPAVPSGTQAAPAAPGLATATTGGTIAAGTWTLATTWVTASGETTIGTTATQVTTGTTSTITATVAAFPAGVIGWNLYMAPVGAATPLYKQNTSLLTALSQTITASAAGTNNPPGANGAILSPVGQVWLALLTTGGDLIPLGATGAGTLYNSFELSRCGAGILPDIMANQTLICTSVGVVSPVALTVILGVSLMGIRSHAGE